MNIKSLQILGANCLDEITNPIAVYEYEPKGIVAILHSYYTQWSGRHIELYKRSLSLYNKQNLQLIAHLADINHLINEIDFHPNQDFILLATGSYDGGYSYKGELLLWDYQHNKTQRLIADNREYTSAKFIEDQIKTVVSPPTDDEVKYPNDETYIFDLEPNKSISLQDLKPIKQEPHKDKFGTDDWEEQSLNFLNKLNELTQSIGKIYEPKELPYDIVFINTSLVAVAYTNAYVEIYDVSSQTSTLVKLPEEGDCVELFYIPPKNTLVVTISLQNRYSEIYTKAYEIDLQDYSYQERIRGGFTLSMTKNYEFLARQTDHINKDRDDFVYDRDFQIIAQKKLGHYDLFNHYLRIDGAENLYTLVGNPRDQHQDKELLEINPQTGDVQSIFEIEKQPLLYNDLSGLLIEDTFILQGKVHDYDSHKKNYEIFAFQKNQGKIWTKPIQGQSCKMTKIESHPNYFALCVTTGDILIINAANGETIADISLQKQVKIGFPISIANQENKLLIAYDNGLIELFEIN